MGKSFNAFPCWDQFQNLDKSSIFSQLRIWTEGGHLLSAETWIANSFHLVEQNFRFAQRFFEEDAGIVHFERIQTQKAERSTPPRIKLLNAFVDSQSQGILPERQSADMAYQQAAASAMDMDTLHFPSIRPGLHAAKAQCH
ncbi:hypothetical protein B0H13DRAFT_1856449 [Mycena leptocephala]|nr:hypothetical protein B0H13DRAFT_1856449 [Mycena leptocephala]